MAEKKQSKMTLGKLAMTVDKLAVLTVNGWD